MQKSRAVDLFQGLLGSQISGQNGRPGESRLEFRNLTSRPQQSLKIDLIQAEVRTVVRWKTLNSPHRLSEIASRRQSAACEIAKAWGGNNHVPFLARMFLFTPQ